MKNVCKACGHKTNNPKFCGRSCSAKFNNNKFPKRKPLGICLDCGGPCKKRGKRCLSCSSKNRSFFDKSTMGDLRKHKNMHQRLRYHSRKVGSVLENVCLNCGYSKHTDVCHIKDIKDFTDDCLVSEVNDINNLVRLCKNCHWEFDNNLLEIKAGLA